MAGERRPDWPLGEHHIVISVSGPRKGDFSLLAADRVLTDVVTPAEHGVPSAAVSSGLEAAEVLIAAGAVFAAAPSPALSIVDARRGSIEFLGVVAEGALAANVLGTVADGLGNLVGTLSGKVCTATANAIAILTALQAYNQRRAGPVGMPVKARSFSLWDPPPLMPEDVGDETLERLRKLMAKREFRRLMVLLDARLQGLGKVRINTAAGAITLDRDLVRGLLEDCPPSPVDVSTQALLLKVESVPEPEPLTAPGVLAFFDGQLRAIPVYDRPFAEFMLGTPLHRWRGALLRVSGPVRSFEADEGGLVRYLDWISEVQAYRLSGEADFTQFRR